MRTHEQTDRTKLIEEVRILQRYFRKCSRYSDWLLARRSGDRIPVRAKFSSSVQTGPGDHPASCSIGTGSFLGVKSGRGVMVTPHLVLVPWSWKSRAILLLPLWVIRPVQSLSACTRVHFTFTFTSESNATLNSSKYAELKHDSKVRPFIKYSNISISVTGRVKP